MYVFIERKSRERECGVRGRVKGVESWSVNLSNKQSKVMMFSQILPVRGKTERERKKRERGLFFASPHLFDILHER